MIIKVDELIDESLENYCVNLTSENRLPTYKTMYDTKKGFCQTEGTSINDSIFVKADYHFFQDTVLTHDTVDDCCFISIPNEHIEIVNETNKKSTLLKKGCINLGISKQDESYTTKYYKDKKTTSIEFYLSIESMKSYLVELGNYEIIEHIKEINTYELLNSIVLSPRHQVILNKMKENPYKGKLRKLFFENCMNELLFLVLDSLDEKPKEKTFKLSSQDKEMIEKANQILLENFQDPPTISELSKLVATNEDKLKKGFKILFNNTIFNTVTNYRLQNAYDNIKRTDKSIDEIAYESGYKSTSSFINVFKKRYGETPGQMKNKKYMLCS